MKITQIFNEIEKNSNELDYYLKLKENNYRRKNGDTLINEKFDYYNSFMINDVNDNKIMELQDNIICLNEYLNNEIKRLKKYDDLCLIIFLKDVKHWSWVKIDMFLNYADGTSKKKYFRYKKKEG